MNPPPPRLHTASFYFGFGYNSGSIMHVKLLIPFTVPSPILYAVIACSCISLQLEYWFKAYRGLILTHFLPHKTKLHFLNRVFEAHFKILQLLHPNIFVFCFSAIVAILLFFK